MSREWGIISRFSLEIRGLYPLLSLINGIKFQVSDLIDAFAWFYIISCYIAIL